jgi:hypothetical protein
LHLFSSVMPGFTRSSSDRLILEWLFGTLVSVGVKSVVSESLQDIEDRSHEVRGDRSPEILRCGRVEVKGTVVFEGSPSPAKFGNSSPVEFPQGDVFPVACSHCDAVPECDSSIANTQASENARARRRFYGK